MLAHVGWHLHSWLKGSGHRQGMLLQVLLPARPVTAIMLLPVSHL
jgi:hypothetical protein